MINWTLYRREMRAGAKLLLIFGAIMTMYVVCIIALYDPVTVEMLDGFTRAMPQIMAAVGMTPGATHLLGFMISYLYGFVLLIFPMVYSALRANGLIAKYVDGGAMVYLVAAPVRRRTIACTQMLVLLSGIGLLLIYTTALEAAMARVLFPGALAMDDLLVLNGGLLVLHFMMGGICFLASCLFSETKYSFLLGAGLPVLMYVFQMVANVGDGARFMRYFSAFSLFDPNGLAAFAQGALLKAVILMLAALVLYPAGIAAFCKKDLHI